MAIVVWICCAIFLWYPLYLLRNVYWLNVGRKAVPGSGAAMPKITVIVPARNAAHELPRLMESLSVQQYPSEHWTCLVIDDGSTDETREVVGRYSTRIPGLRLLDAPPCVGPAFKKNAIAEGIRQASGDWILTTDADCWFGPEWLITMASRMQDETALVSGPVQLNDDGKIFSKFQQLEFAGLIGIGAANIWAGTPNMCNGANLAYRKTAFYSVGGFRGVDQLASGDDELLLHRIFMNNLGKLDFAMDSKALVYTPACPDLSSFARQRIRWVSKGRQYERKSVTYILTFSYLAILALASCTLLLSFVPQYWSLVGILWFFKALCEAVVILPVLRLGGNVRNMGWIIAEQPLHVMYVIWAGVAGTFSRNYIWKGREVK